MGGVTKPRELIACHDCGGQVSFSARHCPHCGSTEQAGPYVHGPRQQRLIGAEARNDQTVMGMLVLCCGIGFFFGAVTGGMWPAIGYGVVGAIIGVPAGFIINMSRRLFG
jgi:hypothetical protein